MERMARPPVAASLVLALLATACSDVEQATNAMPGGSDGTGTGSDTAPGTTAFDGPGTGDASATGDTGPGGTTTSAVSATGTTDDPSTTGGETLGTTSSTGDDAGSSSGGVPECGGDDECAAYETCDLPAGQCVPVCAAWGSGGYGSCVDAYGNFDANATCGAALDAAVCVYAGFPVTATGCSVQGCTSICDCPAPPATGDAPVTCGDITGAVADCYLSCESGETCPDGMACFGGVACLTTVPDVPQYGDCGNLASDCITGTCAIEGGYSVCVDGCGGVGTCDPPPAGGSASCAGLIFPPNGSECVLDCNGNPDCPAGMDCYIDPDIGGGTGLCMWPLFPNPGGNCCSTHAMAGCNAPFIESCTCALDSYCCTTSWDQQCVNEALDNCAMACP
jgi:hypothetical protein